MLSGKKKRDWQIFYENEDNKEEPLPSEETDKKTALDYLYIFDDAIYIENIKTKKKIYKKDVEQEIKNSKKSNDPYIELIIMTIVGFGMGFILYQSLFPILLVSLVVVTMTAIALIVGNAVDEIIGPDILRFKEEEAEEETEQEHKEERPPRLKRSKSKDPMKIILT